MGALAQPVIGEHDIEAVPRRQLSAHAQPAPADEEVSAVRHLLQAIGVGRRGFGAHRVHAPELHRLVHLQLSGLSEGEPGACVRGGAADEEQQGEERLHPGTPS